MGTNMMREDSLVLALEGEISLEAFAQAIKHFQSLVHALTKEISPQAPITWHIEDLQGASAVTTVCGSSSDSQAVPGVVSGFWVVGQSLQRKQVIPYSEAVRRPALALAQNLDNSIRAIKFETHLGEAVIAVQPQEEEITGKTFAWGQVKGIAQTLSSRRGLKLTLYDPIFDRPILCFLREDQQEMMRGVWGKRVSVIGKIGRESEKKRAVVVFDIQQIEILPPSLPGSYRQARGVLAQSAKPHPEKILRRLRDEE